MVFYELIGFVETLADRGTSISCSDGFCSNGSSSCNPRDTRSSSQDIPNSLRA
jgi:hypothetical protein